MSHLPGSGAARKPLRTFVVALGATLITASAADAATLSVDGGVLNFTGAGELSSSQRFSDGPAADEVTVSTFNANVGDNDPIVPGANCTANGLGGFVCSGVTSLNLDGAGGRDELYAPEIATRPSTILGGTGDDIVLFGGGGDDTIDGGPGIDDALIGFDGNDTIRGGDGNDVSLIGEGGNDVIEGGDGNDRNLRSGPGDDTIRGGAGNDSSLYGNEGVDTIDGGAGNDRELDGGFGDDTVDGGDGDDTLEEGYEFNFDRGFVGPNSADDDNLLRGGAGRDTLLSYFNSRDTLQGGDGGDTFVPFRDEVADTFDGGAGVDTVNYGNYNSTAVTISFNDVADDGAMTSAVPPVNEGDNVLGMENALGGSGDDVITGNAADNELYGNSNNGFGFRNHNSGTDNNTISGLDGNDLLGGGNGIDTLAGGEGSDELFGGDQSDTLGGDGGDDVMYASGGGSDALNGGSGSDTVDYTNSFGVKVSLDGVADDGDSGEGDNAGADVENVIGSNGRDTLVGNAAANFLEGNAGNDLINAVDGTNLADIVSCGTGFDTANVDAIDAAETTGTSACENLSRAAAAAPPVVPGAPVAEAIVRQTPKLSLTTTPARDRKVPLTFRSKGKLTLPAGVSAAQACGSDAFVAVTVKRGTKTISTRRAKLSRTCSYSSTVTIRDRKRLGKSTKLSLQAKFSGNRFLLQANSVKRSIRIR